MREWADLILKTPRGFRLIAIDGDSVVFMSRNLAVRAISICNRDVVEALDADCGVHEGLIHELRLGSREFDGWQSRKVRLVERFVPSNGETRILNHVQFAVMVPVIVSS